MNKSLIYNFFQKPRHFLNGICMYAVKKKLKQMAGGDMSKSSNRKRITNNFNKRFGDRIGMVYMNEPPEPAVRHIQNTEICKAFINVLTGILGRAPTQNEILGIEDISEESTQTSVSPP